MTIVSFVTDWSLKLNKEKDVFNGLPRISSVSSSTVLHRFGNDPATLEATLTLPLQVAFDPFTHQAMLMGCLNHSPFEGGQRRDNLNHSMLC